MRKRGFTLIELVIVAALLVIVGAMITVGASKAKAKARLAKVSEDLTDISKSLAQYAEDNNYAYPPDAGRAVPPGLERYLVGGTWPKSAWPHGVFDWDNWSSGGQQVYQISYRLCDTGDPDSACSDPILFPNFTRNSAIYYCISGPCVPHESAPTAPAYCVNCRVKPQNY